jgi:hypothetical protein
MSIQHIIDSIFFLKNDVILDFFSQIIFLLIIQIIFEFIKCT